MENFLLSLQFLTTIPVRTRKSPPTKAFAQSMVYFPLIGLLLGLLLAGTNNFLTALGFERLLIGTILVVLLIILTGGLHLDGLADTFDAVFSTKEPSKMLQIMRDPHVGTWGVLALISTLLLKITIIFSIRPELLNGALILTCLASRAALALVMFTFSYAREEGKAKIFVENISSAILIKSLVLGILLSFAAGKFLGLSALVSALAFSVCLARFLSRQIKGITGDILGAVGEITELFILTFFLFLAG